MRATVIVATLRRPDHVRRSLASVAACRPAPHEVLVVDGDPERSAEAIVEEWSEKGLAVRHIAAPTGLTRQRNVGLDTAEGDIVIFLDDDASVPPDALHHLARAYEDPTVVGVTGRIVEPHPTRVGAKSSPIRKLLPGGGGEGQFTRYGYPNRLVDETRERDVEFMQGAFMTARTDPARATRFDEHLLGYGLAEDEDFSYRLAKRGRIRYLPHLVVHHANEGFGTRDTRVFGKQVVVNRSYLFRKNFAQTPSARAQFWLLIAVLCAHRVLNADVRGLAGIVDGIIAVARGRV